MQYMKDRDRLNEILMTAKDIKDFKMELFQIVPELIICEEATQEHPAHIYKVLEHIFEVVNKVGFDLIIKLTALFHDIGKPYRKRYVDGIERFWGHEDVSEVLARLILGRLEYDQDIIDKVCLLIKHHDHKAEPTVKGVHKLADLVGIELMPRLLEFQTADLLAHSEPYAKRLIPFLNGVKKIYQATFDNSSK